MATVIISELLCYVMNKYGKTPHSNVKSVVVVSFFNGLEISTAKKLPYTHVS